MADVVDGTRRLAWVVVAAFVVACTASPAPISAPPYHRTAVAACTNSLGQGWQVAVEVDRAEGSTVALVSGDSVGTCQTWSNVTRTGFGNTATAVGLHPTPSQSALSYLTAGGTGDETSYLVGRVPPSASAVRLAFADGSEQNAVLGGGLWLVWLEQPVDTVPTVIEALDSAGTVLSRLANPDGIQPAG